jgi:hypothetical protein
VLFILTLLVFLPDRVFSQAGSTGAISGIITDSQGAAIVGADVQAKQTATGVVSTTKSNDAGVFTFPYLQIGQYEVRITAPGMKETVVTGISVDQNNISRIDRVLQVGSVGERIFVTDEAPLVQQESTTYDAKIDHKFVEDLPVGFGGDTRAATDFVNLVPGAQTPGATSGQSFGSQFGVNVGGGRQFATEFQLDGMNIAYQGVTANVPLDGRPDVDLVQETKVQIGVPTAEYGRTSSGVVTFLSRSGTNDIHGNASVFIKNTKFDARAFNAASVGTDQQWEMPLSIGGPVWIPKLYNGRNRTFFFFNYTAQRQKSGGNPGTVTLPTKQERNGDFSDLSAVIYDPDTHIPFLGNVIPASRIGGVAKKLNEIYPQPTNDSLANNFNGITQTSAQRNDYFAKIDHNLSDRNHLSGSIRWRTTDTVIGGGLPYGDALSGNSTPRGIRGEIISDDWTISPTLVNHFSGGEQSFWIHQNSQPLDPNLWPTIPNTFAPAFPSFCFDTNGYSGMGTSLAGCSAAAVNYESDRSQDYQDSLFWAKGKHNFKFGVRYLRFQAASGSLNTRSGIYHFSSIETGQIANGAPVSGTGNSYASFLLGAVHNSHMESLHPPNFRTHSWGFYAQDDFKINGRLTINYGLRWDIQPNPDEANDAVSTMDPTLPNAAAGGRPGAYIFASQKNVQYFSPTWYGAFSPRLGIAYSVNQSLVVRASAGILFTSPSEGGTPDTFGYSGSEDRVSPDGGITPAMNWDRGWTNVHVPPFFDPTAKNGGSASIYSHNGDRWPSTNVIQLDVQKSFGQNFVLNVGYLGQASHHIPGGLNLPNQLNPKYLALGSLLNASITDPAVVAAGYDAPYPGFVGTLAQALQPYPQYPAGVSVVSDKIGNSSYHALLVKAEKRFSNGLAFLTSYTFSKTLADIALNAFGRSGPQDTYNRKVEKALAPYDIPQALVVSFTYQLPVGPGRPFLSKGLWSNILGNWALSGILNYTSGTPVSISAPNTLPIGNGRLGVNYLGGDISTHVSRGDTEIANGLTGQAGTVVLDKNAFAFPAPFTFGNTWILPNVRTLGFKSESISLFKRVTVKERYQFEVRFDMLNALNRKDPGGLNTDLTSPAFGQYSSSNIGPRTGQLGAKFSF